MRTDKDGSRLNLVKLDRVDSMDEKVLGKRLQEIAKNATTGGLAKAVGGAATDSPIKVVSERMLKKGLEFTDNRFVVEGNHVHLQQQALAMADSGSRRTQFPERWRRYLPQSTSIRQKNEALKGMAQLQFAEIAGQGVVGRRGRAETVEVRTCPRLTARSQLELAPPTPEVAERENDGQEVKTVFGRCTERAATHNRESPQIRSPANERKSVKAPLPILVSSSDIRVFKLKNETARKEEKI